MQYGNQIALAVLLYIFLHTALQKTRMLEIKTIAMVTVIGLLIDTILANFQVLHFSSTSHFLPIWFMILWPLFGTTLNHSLLIFARLPLIILIPGSAMGAYHAYDLGQTISNAYTVDGHSGLIIAATWGLIFPLFMRLMLRFREKASLRT